MKGRKERKSITDREKDAIMALIRLGEDDETIAKFTARSVIAINFNPRSREGSDRNFN